MDAPTDSIASARKKCARQFAAWLIGLPELSDWEERKWLANDLVRTADRLEESGRTIHPFLPSLRDLKTPDDLAAWTEAVMKELDLTPPEWSKEQSPLERVQDLVNRLEDAAIPVEPSEFR